MGILGCFGEKQILNDVPDLWYGYQFHVDEIGNYAAEGLHGQWILIAPEHDLVVVFTSNFSNQDLELIPYYTFFLEFILPSVLE